MKLYRIDFLKDGEDTVIKEREVVLEPAIPFATLPFENNTTRRVCFCETLSACASACTFAGELEEEHSNNEMEEKKTFLWVTEIETEELEEEYLYGPSYLLRQGVADAEITREWWYTEPINVKQVLKEVKEFYSTGSCETFMIEVYDEEYIERIVETGKAEDFLYDIDNNQLEIEELWDAFGDYGVYMMSTVEIFNLELE